MPLLTELGNPFWWRFYKDAAPTALGLVSKSPFEVPFVPQCYHEQLATSLETDFSHLLAQKKRCTPPLNHHLSSTRSMD
jgi:hypothetical protein